MVVDEKGVVRRDDIRIEDGEWRFQLWRPARQDDHRTLLRIFNEWPFPILKWQHCRGRKSAQRRSCHSERCDGSPGMLYEAAAIDHCFCLSIFGRWRPNASAFPAVGSFRLLRRLTNRQPTLASPQA